MHTTSIMAVEIFPYDLNLEERDVSTPSERATEDEIDTEETRREEFQQLLLTMREVGRRRREELQKLSSAPPVQRTPASTVQALAPLPYVISTPKRVFVEAPPMRIYAEQVWTPPKQRKPKETTAGYILFKREFAGDRRKAPSAWKAVDPRTKEQWEDRARLSEERKHAKYIVN